MKMPAQIPKVERPRRARTTAPILNRASVGRVFSADTEGKIDLYDEIGEWGISAAEFKEVLDGINGPEITLRINSPGGDVFDGIAMYNDLVSHPAHVKVIVTGVAASAASIIAMAGDEIEIADNAFLMIHNAWTLAFGNKADFEEVIGLLTKIDAALAQTYVARSRMDEEEVVKLMNEETWLTAKDAEERGLARRNEAEEVTALFNALDKVFPGLPAAAVKEETDAEPTIRDTERALRDAGFSRKRAKSLVSGMYGDEEERDAPDESHEKEILVEIYKLLERSI